VRRLDLRKTRSGATLTVHASSGVRVGVASQPGSGIVRLVVEAGADAAALSARPRIEGARVTGVRKTGDSVFVTLALDPGWVLGGIDRFSGGARIKLRAQAA
jgi:hypothetical protein